MLFGACISTYFYLIVFPTSQAVLACRATGDPIPTLSFGDKIYNWQIFSWLMQPLSYNDLIVRTFWVENPFGSWYRLRDAPYGLVTEAVVNITMSVK